DHLIYFRCQYRNRSAGLIEPLSEHHAPARASGGVNSSGNQRGPRTLGEESRQRRSGRQPPEKRRPNPVIASMLIRQNADASAGAQQLDHRLKSVVAIEQFQSRLTAGPPHMLVNETVAQPLVYTRISNKPNEFRHQLREHFPRSEVTQNEHHRNACAKFPRHRLDIFDFDALEDFLWRHLRQLCAAKQVRTEPPEMSAHKLTQFARRLFIRKRDLKVAGCQTPIFPGKSPRATPEELPNSE